MPRELPSVTLIVAAKNASKHVSTFAAQVRRLDYADLHVVAVDDGSDDDTLALLRTHLPAGSTILSNGSGTGVAGARNVALNHAASDYVWFVDIDDRFPPSAVRLLAEAAIPDSPGLIIGRAEAGHIGDSTKAGQIVDGLSESVDLSTVEILSLILRGSFHGYLWNKLVRRDLLNHPHFPLISSQSDLAGLMNALGPGVSARTIPDVVYCYVKHPNSITTKRSPVLDNLVAASAAVIEAAKSAGAESADIAYFRCTEIWLAGVNTMLRHSAATDNNIAVLRSVHAQLRLRDFMAALSVRRGPTIAALIAYALPATYNAAYHARARLRRPSRAARGLE